MWQAGNLVFNKSAQNFNSVMCKAAKVLKKMKKKKYRDRSVLEHTYNKVAIKTRKQISTSTVVT